MSSRSGGTCEASSMAPIHLYTRCSDLSRHVSKSSRVHRSGQVLLRMACEEVLVLMSDEIPAGRSMVLVNSTPRPWDTLFIPCKITDGETIIQQLTNLIQYSENQLVTLSLGRIPSRPDFVVPDPPLREAEEGHPCLFVRARCFKLVKRALPAIGAYMRPRFKLVVATAHLLGVRARKSRWSRLWLILTNESLSNRMQPPGRRIADTASRRHGERPHDTPSFVNAGSIRTSSLQFYAWVYITSVC